MEQNMEIIFFLVLVLVLVVVVVVVGLFGWSKFILFLAHQTEEKTPEFRSTCAKQIPFLAVLKDQEFFENPTISNFKKTTRWLGKTNGKR